LGELLTNYSLGAIDFQLIIQIIEFQRFHF